MEESIALVSKLYGKYKNCPKTQNKMKYYLENRLPILLEDCFTKERNRLSLEKTSNHYIDEFLMNPDRQYFYIEASDTFIKYNGTHYTFMDEDELWYIVLNDITNRDGYGPKLAEYKQQIKNTIVHQIKNRSIFNTIPESDTLQPVINFFMPLLLNTKYETKHFFAVIGDILLNKNKNLIYFVPEKSSSIFLMNCGIFGNIILNLLFIYLHLLSISIKVKI